MVRGRLQVIVSMWLGSDKGTYPSMYKLVDDSSFNCSILVLNESDFE